MSLLLLLRADPRALLTADVTSGTATLVVTFTVDDLDPGDPGSGVNPIWRFDPGDASPPLYFDAGTWSRDPAGTGDTPSSGDPIVYAYTRGSGGPRDATLSIETDDGTYLAARLTLDIDDGTRPTGTLTADVYAGSGGSLDVTYTATLTDDAGLTVTGWDIDFGDSTFAGLQPGEPDGDTITHTYTGPFLGAAHLIVYTDELTP